MAKSSDRYWVRISDLRQLWFSYSYVLFVDSYGFVNTRNE